MSEIEYGLSHAEDIDEAASESKVHRRLGGFTFRHFALEQFSSGTDEIETTKRGGCSLGGGHEMESRDIGSCCGYRPNKDWLSVTAFLQTDDDGAFIAVVDLRALDMPDDLRNWPLFMARPLAARAAAPAASVR